jgi:D-alanyl-D-alanine carboxypeptidase/D-alanyl-D-alanine-endopeptidase (penicillin-binding protein 4)
MKRIFSRRAWLLAALLMGCAVPLLSSSPARCDEPPAANASPARTALAQDLDRLLDAPPLDHSFAGAMVVSLKTGETLYARNADRRFMPASNTKLFTSAAALEYLGPMTTFETRAVLRGKPGADSKTWAGNLALIGGGDPSLSSDDLAKMAKTVAASGIRRITGGLLLDSTLFQGPGRGPGWGWDWEGDYYAAPASALTVDTGRLKIIVKPGMRKGGPPTLAFEHPECGFTLVNRAVTGPASSKVDVTIARRHAQRVIDVIGTIPLGGAPYDDEVAVDDPSDLAGRIFRAALKRAGVVIAGGMKAVPPSDSDAKSQKSVSATGERVVATRRSQPLSELLRRMNLPSDNNYAETLLRQVGVAWKRKQEAEAPEKRAELEKETTADLGLDAERVFLATLGIPSEEVRLVDGSGLSRLDLITPRAAVKLLQAMNDRPDGEIYIGSLPVAGKTGTLRRRMKDTPAEGAVTAKTGTLTGASALTGEIRTHSGDTLLFSLLMNQHIASASDVRAVQDRFCIRLARE